MLHVAVSIAICFSVFQGCLCKTDDYFTAAAFEFVQMYNYCPESRSEADWIVKTNLDQLVRAGKLAAERDADIIAFPEYSIFPECHRNDTLWFLETVPDPKVEYVIPCDEPNKFSDRPQLFTLSCLAKNHSMYVQGNTGDVQYCNSTFQPKCPPDGRFQMNTNVVFDRKGGIVLKYHKEHLWNEFAMDMDPDRQNPVFTTDFGTYASFVCYDVVLARIVEVVNEPGVDGVIFSTMWENGAPLFMSVQYFQSWAMGNNKTLIAADIQLAGQLSLGSGIFHGKEGALVYTYDPDGISKLLVARVPLPGKKLTEPKSSITAIQGNKTFPWMHDGVAVPYEGSESSKFKLKDDLHTNRYHEIDMNDHTMVQLTKKKDRVSACHNGMCCTLEYKTDRLKEKFFFAVYNSSTAGYPPLTWCEEDCMLVRCDPRGPKPCSIFPMRSYTVFRRLKMTANFTTSYIYPSVVGSTVRLLPLDEWNYNVTRLENGSYESTIVFEDFSGENLVEVGLKGRCYDRDPVDSFF